VTPSAAEPSTAGAGPSGALHPEEAALARVAARHVGDLLFHAIEHTAARRALLVADARSGLARILTAAYHACLPGAPYLDFDAVVVETVMAAFGALSAGDLVVLVQSTSFRLEAFRIRVELFKRGLKVIEHPHLGRMRPEEHERYVASLAYDPGYYRVVGPALKARIDRASSARVESGAAEPLVYDGPLEPAKLNIGDYSALHNVGGQFPIGEVFSEARQLGRVNGQVRIFVFGDAQFRVNVPPHPITLVVEGGKVVAALDATSDFEAVLAQIRADEEVVWLRELGFGMNRAFTPAGRVSDVGTYERMCGIHLSLGAKHAVYDKPELRRKHGKYHVDVFAITEGVRLDDTVVFENGAWCP
jgi:aminopeptidase